MTCLLGGLGRLRSIQGLPSIMPHGMVETPHSIDFSFSFIHVPCGLQVVSELVDSARNSDFTDIVMIHEHRGEPDGLVVCHMPYGPSAYFGIFNTVRVLM